MITGRRVCAAALALVLLPGVAGGCSFSGSVDDTATSSATPSPPPEATGPPTTAGSSAAGSSTPGSSPSSPPSTSPPSSAPPPSAPPSSAPPSSSPPSSAPGPAGTTPIRFRPGTDTALVAGAAPQGQANRYTFEAVAGQTAELAISSTDDAVTFLLTDPAGTPLKTASSESDQGTYPLRRTGTYVVGVASPRSGVDYSLRLTIPPR